MFPEKEEPRLAECLPRRDEVAVVIESVVARFSAIGDVIAVPRTANENVVRFVEFAGLSAFASPGLDEAAVLGKLHHARRVMLIGVMAVGHENVAVRANDYTTFPDESIHPTPAHTPFTTPHQHFA